MSDAVYSFKAFLKGRNKFRRKFKKHKKRKKETRKAPGEHVGHKSLEKPLKTLTRGLGLRLVTGT